jgi:predicted helicase
VTNARCLGEGVNVPVCDAVAFLAPRRSKVDVVQAVGRAVRLDGTKNKKAYVILPIFIEANETLEQAKNRSAYRDAFDTLDALREHNEALADDIRQLREYLRNPETAAGPRPFDEGKLKIEVDETIAKGIAGIGIKEFREAFEVELAKEIQATPEEKMKEILKLAETEARRLGRIK